MKKIGVLITLSDIKRALTSKGFFIGVAGMVLVIILSSLETIINVTRSIAPLQNGLHVYLIIEALSSDWVTLAIPIICALPFTSAFVDDIQSGFIKQYLHRSGKKQYIGSKLIASWFSAGLVLFSGLIISYLLSSLIFKPMELPLEEGQTIMQPYFIQFIWLSFILFFSGGFWSLLGLTFSAATMSKYMAYASPFILYYVLIILYERYFQSLYMLYPKEWLFPSFSWKLGNLGVVLIIAALSALISIVFITIATRRLTNV